MYDFKFCEFLGSLLIGLLLKALYHAAFSALLQWRSYIGTKEASGHTYVLRFFPTGLFHLLLMLL